MHNGMVCTLGEMSTGTPLPSSSEAQKKELKGRVMGMEYLVVTLAPNSQCDMYTGSE